VSGSARSVDRNPATPELRCRPTPLQQLLLDACLAPEAAACAAWEAWRARADLDRLDEESYRHLPFAYHRLRDLVSADRTLEIARGVYRRAWYQNHLLLRELEGILDRLAEQGIEAMLLKGAAMAVRYYPTPATRPLGDLDLLVRHRDAARAAAALTHAGWVAGRETPVGELVKHAHGVALRRGAASLDLHWNALWAKRTSDADDQFWEAAEPVDFRGRRALALAPSDELVHACMHGARRSQNAYSWQPLPLVRWATDAALVLRGRAVDWSRVEATAARFHARLQLRDAFGYLKEGLGLAVPEQLLATWEAVDSPADRLHYELALARRAPRRFPSLPRFRFWSSHRMRLYLEHGQERVEGMSWTALAAAFPAYLASFVKVDLDAERLLAVPGRLARKLARSPSLLRP